MCTLKAKDAVKVMERGRWEQKEAGMVRISATSEAAWMITSVKVRTCHIASMSVSVTVRVCSSAYGSCCYILVLQCLNYELTSMAINTYQSVKYVVLIYVFILSIICWMDSPGVMAGPGPPIWEFRPSRHYYSFHTLLGRCWRQLTLSISADVRHRCFIDTLPALM